MKKHIKLFMTCLSIYFSIAIFSGNLLRVEVSSSLRKKLCASGTFKKTLRSYEGQICEIPLLGAIAKELCTGVGDFDKSKCNDKISPLEGIFLKVQVANVLDSKISSFSDLIKKTGQYITDENMRIKLKKLTGLTLDEAVYESVAKVVSVPKPTIPVPEAVPVAKPTIPVPKPVLTPKEEVNPTYITQPTTTVSMIPTSCEDLEENYFGAKNKLRKKGDEYAECVLALELTKTSKEINTAQSKCNIIKNSRDNLKKHIEECFPKESL